MVNKLYQLSPVWMQNLACSILGLREKKSRLGGIFKPTLDFLTQSEWWNEKRIEEYQNQNLQDLIAYSYHHIPYYYRIFNQLGLRPEDIKSRQDLVKLPILTKEDIRKHYQELKSTSFQGKIIPCHTSGSTGKSLQFLFSQDAIQYRWALWFRHRNRFGISPEDPYATFTGQTAIPLKQKKPPYWRKNYPMKQTVFTMHHINTETTPHIVKRLNKGGFAYYSGYPSIIYNLAGIIEDLELQITTSPQVIFTGAESLLAYQREKISRVFGCPVTDQYGFSEGCGNASRCEHDLFHEDFEYGILECHNPVRNDDGSITGEILATGFTNLAMSFIRYQVGDTATWIDKECSCGRKTRTIKEINGRNEDFVITPEGNKILRFDYLFKDTEFIEEAQVVQKELGSIIIRIVKRPGYSSADEQFLIKEVHEKISSRLKVLFEYPSEIERERTGKFRAVKSFLKRNES
ncbi:MAG: phenylacetate--CoA ligase family protein [Rikenellaceae bacterium]|nr:phenylacetate--CoA ligase family protein [Rikenellaceae bacterium]